MAYLNTQSGLGGFLDNLTGQINARVANNDQLRGLVAGGVIPASMSPGPSFLDQLRNGLGLGSPQQPPAAPMGVPQAPMAPMAPPAPPAGPVASAAPSSPGPLPTMAAMQGVPQGSGLQSLFRSAETQYGLPAGYLAQTAAIESKFNPKAVSSTGAMGPFQFTKGTAAQYGVTDPTDWAQSTDGAARLAAANGGQLQQALGRPPTAGELYLAHQQGAGGAAALLTNPNARAGDVVGDRAVAVNGGDPNMPAGAFAARFTSRFGQSMSQTPANMTSAIPGAPAAPQQASASPFGALNPNAFASDAPQLPMARAQNTPAPPPGGSMGASAAGAPQPIDANGNALGYAPPGASAAPASRAIAGAAPAGDPLVAVPGYAGQWNKAKIDAAPDGTDVPDEGELAKAQAGGLPAAPAAAPAVATPPVQMATGPGVANAQSPQAPIQQAPNPAAAQGVVQPPSIQQIQALIQNPATRQMGLSLWQSYLTPKDGFTLSEGQARFNAQGQRIAGIPDKPVSVSAGSSLVDPATGKPLYSAPASDSALKLQVIGEDQYGNKQYGTFDPNTGKVTPTTQPGASAARQDAIGLHGNEFLATLDPNTAGQVKAIVEGRAPYPTGMLLKTPYGQKLAEYVTQTDPTFESGNAASRNKVRSDYTSGTIANQITAGNTAIQHLGELSDAAEALSNGNIPLINGVRNSISTNTGGKTVTDFNNILGHFSEEAVKFYRGSGGTEADVERDLKNMNANQSPEQLHSAIQKNVELMQGKINALQDRWRQGMGPMVGDFPVIQPKSQAAVQRIAKRAGVSLSNDAGQQEPAQPQAGVGIGAATAQVPGARQAPDGNWYVADPNRPGKYLMVTH